MIVYISIGNSDNKLSQAEWAAFQLDVAEVINGALAVTVIHGEWVSLARAAYRNACWCVELRDGWTGPISGLRDALHDLARRYDQDSIAWAEAPATEFLGAVPK
jgi:hypothetical protein